MSTRDRLPIDPRTGRPLAPRAQPGYYPGYSTLAQQEFWDEATRAVVIKRVHDVPPIRFFSADEASFLAAVFDRVLPQDDRDEAHRIPIVPVLDERLHLGRGDGYRYASMPPDGDAYRLAIRAIDEIARHLFARGFLACGGAEQDTVLQSIHDGKPPAAHEIWKQMEPHRFWLMLVKDAAEAYYAHPWAWDEIGFGGPAYPRGYMRLEKGMAEPWEVDEQRYEWAPPPDAKSHVYEGVAGTFDHFAKPGEGGTH